MSKIFILSEELSYLKNKWICDVFKDEFVNYVNENESCGLEIVDSPERADIIWLLASWYLKKIHPKILSEKNVVSTIHHIDHDKYEESKKMYQQLDGITNRYHVICPKVENDIKKITEKNIVCKNFWINDKAFFPLSQQNELRKKYKIPEGHCIVGSFQRDTEGKDPSIPKLSKGPDIFVKIINDMKINKKNPFVVLTGWRRTYVINELEKINVPYIYEELVDPDVLNELYNCLDLYIVSSRVEGGPRAIMECGIIGVPIISTDVGIAKIILNEKSIYDVNDYLTYVDSVPDTNIAHENAAKYIIDNYMQSFINDIFLSPF